jgi:hypothetical protein
MHQRILIASGAHSKVSSGALKIVPGKLVVLLLPKVSILPETDEPEFFRCPRTNAPLYSI